MKRSDRQSARWPVVRQVALATALSALWGAATAQTTERFTLLTTPESTARIGVATQDGDSARFGQYSGRTDGDTYGLLDLDLARRDNLTGTWLRFYGRNLGLDNRELRADYHRQGQWRLFGAYSETPRVSQYVVSTGLAGVGGDVLAVQTGGRRDIVPETTRRRGTIGLDRQFGNDLSLEVRASSEEKEGTRLFGRGNFAVPPTFNFLAEPIKRTTKNLEVRLGQAGERFQWQTGYLASVLDSGFSSLTVTGGGPALNGAGTGTFSPIALPPGNQSHHVFVSGAWDLGPGSTTRGNFKAAYTRATQDEPFIGNPPGVTNSATTGNISGRTDAGGRLVTTLLQAGVSSRPLPGLNLNARLRYEDRDDRTPVATYLTASGAASHDGTNEPRSIRYTTGKLAAQYALPEGFRLGGSLDVERRKRDTTPVRVVAHREHTDETSFRLDLRRAFSDTFNGNLAVARSTRDGSDFAFTARLNGTAYSNLIAPAFLADRVRDNVRFEGEWLAAENLSVQLSANDSRDVYDTRHDLGLGLRRGRARFASLDAAYTLSRDWKLGAWASHSRNSMEQATTPNAAQGTATPAAGIVQFVWSADLDMRSDAQGVSLRGQPHPKLKVGAELQRTRDRSSHDLAAVTGAPIDTLPDMTFSTTTLRLWGIHELRRDFGVRLDYEFDRRKIDDWTWSGFAYAPAFDGTTLGQNPNPRVHFVGLSVYWKFR